MTPVWQRNEWEILLQGAGDNVTNLTCVLFLQNALGVPEMACTAHALHCRFCRCSYTCATWGPASVTELWHLSLIQILVNKFSLSHHRNFIRCILCTISAIFVHILNLGTPSFKTVLFLACGTCHSSEVCQPTLDFECQKVGFSNSSCQNVPCLRSTSAVQTMGSQWMCSPFGFGKDLIWFCIPWHLLSK